MRSIVLVVLVLVGCGAQAPSSPAGDASTAADGDASCPMGSARVESRCVPATDNNCNGMACPRGTFCNVDVADNGSGGFVVSVICE